MAIPSNRATEQHQVMVVMHQLLILQAKTQLRVKAEKFDRTVVYRCAFEILIL